MTLKKMSFDIVVQREARKERARRKIKEAGDNPSVILSMDLSHPCYVVAQYAMTTEDKRYVQRTRTIHEDCQGNPNHAHPFFFVDYVDFY